MKLLPTQKNDIFDKIIENGFNPKDFRFSEELLSKDEIVTYLWFKNTKYYFRFRNDGNFYFEANFSPGERSLEFTETIRGGWKQYLVRVKRWLNYLRLQINTVDKWDIFAKEVKTVPDLFETNNNTDKFSQEELKFISQKIDNIKSDIKKLQLSSDIIDNFNAKLDELNNKAEKYSKTDWKELFIGGIITIIISLAIPPHSSKIIWEIIKHAFSQFILK